MALESDSDALDVGDPAPAFDLPGVDGDQHSLDDFGGYDALLVVFMCNHCPYVQAKFETMNRLADDYDDLAVVGINPNDADEYPEDSFETMVEYADSGDIDITAYLRDESQSTAEAYGAVCTPDPFLFRNDGGTFRLVYHGRFDDALAPDDEPSEAPGFEMRAAIEAVLNGAEPEPAPGPSRGCSIKWSE